ncbi:hypothetical protein E3N88_21502 [Mikania micrantha]|uniref:Chromo domain-containing protein n=1 Tax=Mikania micrantha TaxID=192012 RepID=A0A5N6NLE1_9ASTR|nr:hypothetical protein E3N88_21502 [Mikania micrantha]
MGTSTEVGNLDKKVIEASKTPASVEKKPFEGKRKIFDNRFDIQVDERLHFVEEPIEIADWEVHKLRRSRIKLVKVKWNSRRGPEFTWEREDQMRKKYPHLFPYEVKKS